MKELTPEEVAAADGLAKKITDTMVSGVAVLMGTNVNRVAEHQQGVLSILKEEALLASKEFTLQMTFMTEIDLKDPAAVEIAFNCFIYAHTMLAASRIMALCCPESLPGNMPAGRA